MSKDLNQNGPKPPKLYLQLKIRKEGNPRCPVVISVNCQTIVKEIPIYVKDTQDFPQKLEKTKDEDSHLVTLDVK